MDIHGFQLPQALSLFPDAKILSLDCFDTLVWRHPHAPADVFADLQDITPDQRRWAEVRARNSAVIERRRNETSIEHIYAALLPDADAPARHRAASAELEAEARHAFAFLPTLALMREAKANGLKIIIVSDTYLSSAQLRSLIAAAAGAETAKLIDHIFASSEWGVAKHEGLFAHVLDELGAAPSELLHIGDNPVADLGAPAKLGIPALHLVQFRDEVVQRLRLESACSRLFDGVGIPFQPHRARLSIFDPQLGEGATHLGFGVLGPLFDAFDQWLVDDVQSLRPREGGRLHLAYMMRDGHLPYQVRQAAAPLHDVTVSKLEISRFTATAAALHQDGAIDRLIAEELGSGDLPRLARQLLLKPAEISAVTARGAVTFLEKLSAPALRAKIVRRSKVFADRLVAHVRHRTGCAAGDRLVLVDLGYNGSVQNAIAPLLEQRLSVAVSGRYLLLREQAPTRLDKKGLFGPDHYDHAALDALCASIAAIEQLSTCAQPSVIDYAADGSPRREGDNAKAVQSDIRDRVQAAAIEYGRTPGGWLQPPQSLTIAALRRSAAAVLARFLFLPSPAEIDLLASFDHDVNLGGNQWVPLFDRAHAARELRRSGLFYMRHAGRMFLPAELRGEGLGLSLALLGQRRFGLALARADFEDGSIDVPVMLIRGKDVSEQRLPAVATHDGYFALRVPVGRYDWSVGLQAGRDHEWLEIREADFVPAWTLGEGSDGAAPHRVPGRLVADGLDQVAPGLFHARSPDGFAMVSPPAAAPDADMVLEIIFRPIISRQKVMLSVPTELPVAQAGQIA